MNRINRRDFLKLSGIAAVVPLAPVSAPRFTAVDPSNFEQALAVAQKGDTLLMTDGIYPIVAQVLEVRCNLIADSGARPVLVRANGYTPSLTFHDDAIVSGVWFGGARDNTTERGWLHFGKRLTFQNNIIWNYYGGIGEGGGTGNIYRRNVFVNCGTGQNFHSVYVNNSNPLHSAHVLENLFIGGQSYHIHLWHNPTNTLINGNLSADADYCLVLQGANNTASNNVFWKPSSPGYPMNLSTGSGRKYTRNYHGPIASGSTRGGLLSWFGGPFPADITPSGDFVHAGLYMGYDPTATVVQPGGEVGHLGKSTAEIDGAVTGLKTAFAGTVQQAHDDATIGGHVATLQSVINKWAGQ